MGPPGGRGSPIERRDRDSWSGRVPDPSPPAGPPGSQHGQPTSQRQDGDQQPERGHDPARQATRFDRLRWDVGLVAPGLINSEPPQRPADYMRMGVGNDRSS
jgi:hypothetical protein